MNAKTKSFAGFDYYLNDDQKKIIQAARVPVDCWNPEYYWIVSLPYESLMPTALELLLLRNFIEYKVKSWYNETYQHKLLVEQPLARDGGHNTIVFMKGWEHSGFAEEARNGWHFRRLTWTQGPHFVPAKFGMDEPYVPLSLIQCFDRCERWSAKEPNKRWEEWKAKYPKFYGTVES